MGGEGSFFDLPHPKVMTRIADHAQMEEKLEWATKFADVGLGLLARF